MGLQRFAIRERRAHPHLGKLESQQPRTQNTRERFVHAEELSTVFAFRCEGDARRRRPGFWRSTSAWTVYAGAAFATLRDRFSLSDPKFFQSASGDLPGARIQGAVRAAHRFFPESTQLPGRPACRRFAHEEHLSEAREMADLKEEKVS
jgi:hypothetical protein